MGGVKTFGRWAAAALRGKPGRMWLLLVLLCAGPEAASVTFREGGMYCRVTVAGVPLRELRARVADSLTARPALEGLLDSLGFFDAAWDTVASDTVVLRTGVRAVVEEIALEGDTGALSAAGHSDQVEMAFPRPYDAGELRGYVKALLERLGRCGYPFARADLRVEHLTPQDDSVPRVRLRITLAAGCGYRVDSTVFLGTHTRSRQLLRDTRLAPGAPFDIGRVREACERLASRSYVDSVEALAPRLRRAPDTAGGACVGDGGVVVPFRIVDRRGLAVDGAVTLERDPESGPVASGVLDAGLLNLLGFGETAALTYRGDRSLQRLTVRAGKIYVGSAPVDLSGRFALEIARAEHAFMEGGLEAHYELRRPWRAGTSVRVQESTVPQGPEAERTWHVYGLDVLLDLLSSWPRRGVFSRGMQVRCGVERVYRGEQRFLRQRLDVGAELQAPVGGFLALGTRLASWNVFTDETRLTAAEMYRVGGYRTVRGYPDDYLSARSATWVQLDYMLYLAGETAAYIFTDAGAVWRDGLEGEGAPVWMAGYGMGIRLPVRIGSATVEWGRNIDDRRGLGRIHVRLANRLAQRLR